MSEPRFGINGPSSTGVSPRHNNKQVWNCVFFTEGVRILLAHFFCISQLLSTGCRYFSKQPCPERTRVSRKGPVVLCHDTGGPPHLPKVGNPLVAVIVDYQAIRLLVFTLFHEKKVMGFSKLMIKSTGILFFLKFLVSEWLWFELETAGFTYICMRCVFSEI